MSRIAEALGEGYSYAEITAFLSNDKRVSAAKEEGYSDEDIVNFLRANESALDLKVKAEKDTPIIGGLLSQAEKKPSLIEGITGAKLQDSPRVVPTYTDTLKSTDAAAKAVPNAPITPTNTFADASRQTVTAQEIAKQGVKQDNAGRLRALESTRIDAPAEIDKPFLRGLGSATGDMIAGTVGAFGQVLDATGFGTPESVTKVYQNLKSRADSIRPEDVSKMGEMDQALYYIGSGLASSAGSILAIAQPELALPYLGFMGTTASGSKYQSLIEKGVSKPEAQANALITGTSEALTEMLGIKGGHRVMQYYAKLPLEARRQFTKRLLLGTGVMVMGATEEGTEELINKQVENATDILTGAFMQQTERGNQKTAGKLASTRIAEGSGEAFKGGAYGGLLFGAGGAFVADQQAVKPNSGSEVFRDQLAQQIDGAQFTNDASTIASDRLAPGNAQYTQAPSVTNQSMGNELLDMERTAPRATVDDIMAEDATVDDAIAAARNMVDTATADLDVADVVASVTQPEEMLDGRTDVGGQDAAMAAQGDEGAGVDVPGSGTDTQSGLLGGLAGGSGSAGSMATPAGVDSVAGDAGVQGLTRFAEPDVTNMNYDELSAYIDSANTHNLKLEEAAIRKHMGDDAASKYMAMNRRQRDSWWMNNATVDMDAEANSKEAGTVDTDTLQEIRSAINDFDIESPRDLGRSIAIPAKRAMENPGKRGAEYVQVRNALRYAAEQGWRMADVRAGMAERAVEWAGDDAAELFDKVFAPSQNPTRATTPTTPLPESGANQSVTQAVPAALPVESAAPINPAGEPIAPQPTQPVTQESQTQSPQVASEGVVKEPWQMTRDEYVRGDGFDLSPHAKLTGLKESPWQADDVSRATMTHKFQHILPAIEAGKTIPPEVLAEYPDLQARAVTPAAPAVVVTPAQQKVVDAVNASLVYEQAKLGDKAPPLQQLTVATPEQMTPAVRDALPGVVAALRDLGYKGEVVVVASKNGTPLDFDGVVSSNGKGIVIAADSARPVAFVLGHEFLHELEKEAPDVYKVLADAILANSSEAKVVEHLQKRGYLDAKATAKDVTMPMRAEFVNDTFADMINNPKQGPLILLETAKNMDKADPGSGKDFLTRLNEFIKRVIKGMVGKGYGTEAAINKSEMGAIRKAIAKALTDYNLQAKKAEKAKAAAEQQAEDRQSFSYTDAADLANAMYPKPYHSGIGMPTDPLWAERKAQVYIELARNGVQEKASQWFMRDFDGSVTPYSQVQVLVADALGIKRTGPWRKTLAQKVFDIALENGRKPGGNPKDKDIRMAILLGSRTGQVSSLTGEKHDMSRQAILKAITGKPVPKSKAGITAVETALVDHLGLKDMTKRDMDLAIEDFAMGRAAKAKQETEAAKKAALAAEVERAKAKPVADEMTEDARAKLLERKQMLEDMIATKKEMRQVVPQHYITGLAEVSAKLRGETVDTEAIYSNEVEGHPMFDSSPILRNLIPIKVVNAESAEKSLYRAQDLYKQIAGERAKANHALSIAKTAAQKKAAETALKKLDNTGATQDALDTLREVTLPELARLSKEADAKFGPVEVAPPTDTKTNEVSDAGGAKTDVFAGAPQAFLNRINKAVTNNVPLLVMRGSHVSGAEYTLYEPGNRSHLSADWKTLQGEDSGSDAVKVAMRYREKADIVYATPAAEAQMAEQAQAMADEKAKLDGERKAREDKANADADARQRLTDALAGAKFTKGEFTPVSDKPGAKLDPVSGMVHGGLIVHKSPGHFLKGQQYTISHVATGMAVLHGFKSQPSAKQAAARLSRLADMTKLTKKEDIQTKPFETFTEVAKAIKKNDGDPLAEPQIDAPTDDKPNGTDGPKRKKAGLKRSLRNVITQDTRDALVKGWTQIGGADTAFTYPRSESKSLGEIMLKVAPRLQVEHMPGDVDLTDGWLVFAKDADGKADRTRPGYVMQYKDGKVELNVAEWGEGNDGAALYAAVGNYAYNNGLLFAGDRMGISDTGRARRLENMISLALKYKTTRHIEPHVDMLVDFSWEEGNDNYNLGEMLAASYRLTAEVAPEIEDITYDPDTKEFAWVPAADRRTGRLAGDGQDAAAGYDADTYAAGETVTESDFKKIVEDARDRGGRLGRKTLVRAILSNTFARGAQADEGAGERAGDVVVPRDVTDGVLYSKRESPEYRRAQAAGLDTSPAAVDARRKEQGWSDTVYYHGTRVDVDMLKGGLISLTENSSTAEEYASGGGGNRKNATQLWVSLDDNGDAVEVFEPDYDEGVYVGNLGTVIDEDQWRDMRENGEIDSVRTGANIIPVRIRGKLLDLHHHGYDRNGIETNTQIKDVLGSLDARNNVLARNIIAEAKKGQFNWSNTKYRNYLDAWRDVLNPQLEALGYSGLSYHDDGHSTVAMFSAKNIRSTNAMYNPEFDEGSRLLFSKRVPLQHYGVPKTWGNGGTVMTPMDSAVYTLQDRHIELKRAVQEIKATGAQLDDKWDPYLTEELFHGRAASRAQEFIKSELEPLTKDLLGAGISIAELDDYLWARHAINRNEEMEKINPEQVDANGDRNGSGLTDAEAQAKLDALTPAQQAQLESFALRVDDMNAETRRLMVEYGLETQDTIDLWEGKYPTYVPLMRDVEDEGGVGSGAGYSTGGKTSKRAMGSARAVENILANIANQRDKVINKGEKNRVAMAVYGAALLNPNPDFWGAVNPLKINDNTPANIAAIEKARLRQELTALGLPAASINNMVDRPTEKSIHPITGMVVRSVNPLYMMADNILSVRVNGEDRFVVFNPTSEKAVRAIAALKNLDVTDRTYADPIVENTMHAIGATTRYFAKVNTQYNPVFGAVNFTRDVQGALLNLQSTELKGQQKEVLKDVYRLMKDAAKHGFRMEKLDPADLVLWKQMLLEGGTTGYRDLFKDGKERNEAIVNALDPKNWQGTKWGKVLTANGYLASTEQLLLDKGNGIVKLLSDYNETMENVVRLAVFKAAIDHGLSGAKAASLSKNITTNFNRRGSIGQQAGQLFAFFNAAVQGTARIGETLIDRKPDGKYRISEAGKAIVSGGLIVGMLQPLLLALAGYGDDEPPEFVRDRNLIIPLWSKETGLGYATIPMPLGYHVIPAMTRIPMEAIMQGKAPKDVLWRMMGMFMEAFNPLGGSSSLTLMVSPTVTDPFFSLDLNKDWNGRPIYQESFSDLNESPGHTRAKDNSTELGYGISYAINWLSGGDKYQAGEWSPTPDAVEYMIGQLTGGVGREVMKAWRSGKALATGEAVPTHQIPLVSRFYGRSDGKSGEGPKFYTNLKYFNELRREKLERIEEKDDVSGFKMKNPDHVLIDAVMDARRDVNKLRKHKAELVEKGASRERIRLIDDKITGRMARINKKIEDRRDRLED